MIFMPRKRQNWIPRMQKPLGKNFQRFSDAKNLIESGGTQTVDLLRAE